MPRERLFAYGSNLDRDQMRRRCPSAIADGKGVLKGARLAFAGYSASRGGAVATIRPRSGAEVEGWLFTMERRDLEVLDQAEGCPYQYQRIRVDVRRKGGRLCAAWTYVLTNEEGDDAPSEAYVEIIRRAYRKLGLDLYALAEAETLALRAGFRRHVLPIIRNARRQLRLFAS